MKTKDETTQGDFAYVLDRLGKIPAFGDGIGNKVSKAELAIVLHKVEKLQEEHRKLRSDLSDAFDRLNRELPYNHALLVNIRASLGMESY